MTKFIIRYRGDRLKPHATFNEETLLILEKINSMASAKVLEETPQMMLLDVENDVDIAELIVFFNKLDRSFGRFSTSPWLLAPEYTYNFTKYTKE